MPCKNPGMKKETGCGSLTTNANQDNPETTDVENPKGARKKIIKPDSGLPILTDTSSSDES